VQTLRWTLVCAPEAQLEEEVELHADKGQEKRVALEVTVGPAPEM
jgi:hypothetical protein